MEAKTLNCPMCGASARTDDSHCAHCGARLATIACPTCFELMFLGQKFCPNCGSPAERVELPSRNVQPCPRCAQPLHPVDVGGTNLTECAHCDGLWLANETFEEICRKREQQAVFMASPSLQDPPSVPTIDPIRYLKCPVCASLMNRVNFATCSGVIVDVCKSHGTWFDRAELRRIIAFIQAGGMDKAREREIRRLAEQRSLLQAEKASGATLSPMSEANGWTPATPSSEIDVIKSLGRVVWDLFANR